MDMSSNCFSDHLKSLVEGREISVADIDASVRRVLKMKFQDGLFDEKVESYDEWKLNDLFFSEEHRKSAREVAKRSIVLLENKEQVLPLSKNLNKVAVIGDLAVNKNEFIGPWSFTSDSSKVVTILEGISEAVDPETKVVYAKGCPIDGMDRSGFEEAKETCLNADIIVIAAGESTFMSGEAASKTNLRLSGVQEDLIKELATLNIPIVVLLINGRPLEIGWMKDYVSAIVETWHTGTEGGHAHCRCFIW